MEKIHKLSPMTSSAILPTPSLGLVEIPRFYPYGVVKHTECNSEDG